MYEVPKFTPKVYLIHKDGRKWEFKNITDAANKLYKWRLYGPYNTSRALIGSQFTEHHGIIYDRNEGRYTSFSHYDYIVRNELGDIITRHDLAEIRNENRIAKWRYRHLEQVETAERHFRKIPIPYTRCRRGGYSSYRKIRTTQEHRENDFLFCDEDALEYNINARPRRYQNLPTSWDDIPRSDYRDKGWKRHRKYQWKEKK